jgi:hypothetical protein
MGWGVKTNLTDDLKVLAPDGLGFESRGTA